MSRFSKADVEALRNSGEFDEKWYLEQYPDVRALGMDPVEHYLWLGARMGRNPPGLSLKPEEIGVSGHRL